MCQPTKSLVCICTKHNLTLQKIQHRDLNKGRNRFHCHQKCFLSDLLQIHPIDRRSCTRFAPAVPVMSSKIKWRMRHYLFLCAISPFPREVSSLEFVWLSKNNFREVFQETNIKEIPTRDDQWSFPRTCPKRDAS